MLLSSEFRVSLARQIGSDRSSKFGPAECATWHHYICQKITDGHHKQLSFNALTERKRNLCCPLINGTSRTSGANGTNGSVDHCLKN